MQDHHGVYDADLPTCDLTEPVKLHWRDYDVVYLLAATLGVDTVTSDPGAVLRTNIRIVQNVLD